MAAPGPIVEVLRFLVDNGPARNEAEREHLHDLISQAAAPPAPEEPPPAPPEPPAAPPQFPQPAPVSMADPFNQGG
jgi:hypothetical protein